MTAHNKSGAIDNKLLRRHSGKAANRTIRESVQDIANNIQKGDLIENGGHHMLVYRNLQTFRQIYSEYAAVSLPENEIVLLATQYEAIETVRANLVARGVDVAKHLKDGTLFIVDAQQGYSAGDVEGTFKLALTLAARAKKEMRRGFTWLGDMGSFFAFENIADMMDYELSRPQKYENIMKTVCCYHEQDFATLPERQRKALFDHHYKSIVIM